MANINSRNSGQRTRHDMTGKVDEYLGATFVFVDGVPTLRLRMIADDGRQWFLDLDASETAKVFAGCDQVRSIAPDELQGQRS